MNKLMINADTNTWQLPTNQYLTGRWTDQIENFYYIGRRTIAYGDNKLHTEHAIIVPTFETTASISVTYYDETSDTVWYNQEVLVSWDHKPTMQEIRCELTDSSWPERLNNAIWYEHRIAGFEMKGTKHV